MLAFALTRLLSLQKLHGFSRPNLEACPLGGLSAGLTAMEACAFHNQPYCIINIGFADRVLERESNPRQVNYEFTALPN